MGYMFVNTFLAAPFIALVPAMAQIVLDAGTAGTAVLVTAQGIGAVTMALTLGNLTARFGSRRVLLAVLWSLPPALVVYALMPTLALAAVALFFVGLIYLGALSSFMSIAQLRAPAAIRGRVREPARGHPRRALPARRDAPGHGRRTRSGSARRRSPPPC